MNDEFPRARLLARRIDEVDPVLSLFKMEEIPRRHRGTRVVSLSSIWTVPRLGNVTGYRFGQRPSRISRITVARATERAAFLAAEIGPGRLRRFHRREMQDGRRVRARRSVPAVDFRVNTALKANT